MNFSAPHAYYIPNPYHISYYDHANKIWPGVQIMKIITMQSLHPAGTFSLLGPNILRTNVFSNTLSLYFASFSLYF
jgi:hypothetical protein